MKQVCEAAGFAFSELWTRPSREVVAEEDGSTKVQWEYLLKWADITYINYEAFPEARHLAGKLDEPPYLRRRVLNRLAAAAVIPTKAAHTPPRRPWCGRVYVYHATRDQPLSSAH